MCTCGKQSKQILSLTPWNTTHSRRTPPHTELFCYLHNDWNYMLSILNSKYITYITYMTVDIPSYGIILSGIYPGYYMRSGCRFMQPVGAPALHKISGIYTVIHYIILQGYLPSYMLCIYDLKYEVHISIIG